MSVLRDKAKEYLCYYRMGKKRNRYQIRKKNCTLDLHWKYWKLCTHVFTSLKNTYFPRFAT